MMNQALEQYLHGDPKERVASIKDYDQARSAFIESEGLTICSVENATLVPLADMPAYREAMCRVAAVIYGYILHEANPVASLPAKFGAACHMSGTDMFSLATSTDNPLIYDIGLLAYKREWPTRMHTVSGYKNGGVLALPELLTLCFEAPKVNTVTGKHPKTSLLQNRFNEAIDLFSKLGFSLPNRKLTEAIIATACVSPTLHAFRLK